jgi:glucosamine-6-phosphate deaminase
MRAATVREVAVEVVIVASADEGGEVGARLVLSALAANPELVLGLATGGSPLPLYAALQRRVQDGSDLSGLRGFALDEYVGLPPEHPASYHSVIRREVIEPLGLRPDRVQVPDGMADDIPAACRAYEEAIRSAGGIDVQILGIGTDGHIGFNEPSSSLSSRTRIKTLTVQTRRDNARYFGSVDEVPRHCVTQGLGTIMDARQLLLLAAGEGKAAAVAAAVEGPLTASCPASVLQLHQHATVVVDEAAASRLQHADYYRETYAGKPPWQRL